MWLLALPPESGSSTWTKQIITQCMVFHSNMQNKFLNVEIYIKTR